MNATVSADSVPLLIQSLPYFWARLKRCDSARSESQKHLGLRLLALSFHHAESE
jgi:hypothetical protein